MRCSLPQILLLAFFGCGSSPPPKVELPPMGDIVKTCVMEVSCLRSPPVSSASECVWRLAYGILSGSGAPELSSDELRRYIACGSQATDCATALACASRDHGPAYCSLQPGDSCDGNVLVRCALDASNADWTILTTDCAVLGERCEMANGSASCTTGEACEPTTASARCDGDRFVGCNQNSHLVASYDCGVIASGATCVSSPAGTSCELPGPSCSGPNTCDNDVLTVCQSGRERSLDCAQLGQTCRGGRCEPKGCSPSAVSDTCQSTMIRVCANGQFVSIDCASIGLATCEQNGSKVACR